VDRIPVGTRFTEPAQIGPRDHPAPHTMDTGSFPEEKRLGRGVYHSPHLASRLKNEYSYTSTSLSVFLERCRVKFVFNNSIYFGHSNIIIHYYNFKMCAKNGDLQPLGHWHAYSWFPLHVCCHVRLRTPWRAEVWPKVSHQISQGFMVLELILIIRV